MSRSRFFKLLPLLVALGCAADRAILPPQEDFAQRVRDLGFRSDGLRDEGDHVVVEGDIVLAKADLRTLPRRETSTSSGSGLDVPSSPQLQYNTTHIVSGTNIGQITVDLSQLAGVSDWADAARLAMADYNASGTRVHMTEASPGDITFVSYPSMSDPNGIAEAYFPGWAYVSGKPGSRVLVTTNHNYYALGQKERILVHELGHTIGLRHDNAPNVDQPSQDGAELIPGTPNSDASSVMVGFYSNQYWTGFSPYDLQALTTLYSTLRMSIQTPSAVGSNMVCRFDAIPSGGTPPYTVQWSIYEPSMGFYPYTGTGTQFVTRNNQRVAQTYTVSVTLTDATGATLSRSQSGPVSAPGGYYDSRCTP